MSTDAAATRVTGGGTGGGTGGSSTGGAGGPGVPPGSSPRGAGPAPEPSLGELFGVLQKDLSFLVKKEVELAKAELSTAAKTAAGGAAGLVVAALLGLAGLILLIVCVGEAFSELLPRPLGFLVGAVAFFLVAGVAAVVGIGALKKVKAPTRTITTVKDDIAWAKKATTAPAVRAEG